ncbi:MAG: hypothetical protein JSV13_02450 [Nitrospiraceae bacterium]|nr:MAG: hypothetical protein JSV13_02450 [Nitrospiraceae bacterium]
MTKKDRPLPKPPKTPFGTKKFFEEHKSDNALMFDRMARALVDGTMNEFIQQELPDSLYGRKLTELMMGLMGMMPIHGLNDDSKDQKGMSVTDRTAGGETEPHSHEPPEDVQRAVQSGDVKLLMELLHREHKKRMPDTTSELSLDKDDHRSQEHLADNRNLLDHMIAIAAEHGVSQEWLLMRAMRLYIDAYNRTGRL